VSRVERADAAVATSCLHERAGFTPSVPPVPAVARQELVWDERLQAFPAPARRPSGGAQRRGLSRACFGLGAALFRIGAAAGTSAPPREATACRGARACARAVPRAAGGRAGLPTWRRGRISPEPCPKPALPVPRAARVSSTGMNDVTHPATWPLAPTARGIPPRSSNIKRYTPPPAWRPDQGQELQPECGLGIVSRTLCKGPFPRWA